MDRYDIGNMLLPLITPGPSEPDGQELQEYLKVLVDDLLNLYEDGMESPACPGASFVQPRKVASSN